MSRPDISALIMQAETARILALEEQIESFLVSGAMLRDLVVIHKRRPFGIAGHPEILLRDGLYETRIT